MAKKKKIKKDGKLKKRGMQKRVEGKITSTSDSIEKRGDVIFTPHGVKDDEGEMLDVNFTLDFDL